MNISPSQVFFENYFSQKADTFTMLPKSGSARSNFVAKLGDQKYIVTSNSVLEENESFFYFSELFSKLNLNTPRIIAISEDRKIYIQDFLGDNTLSEIIAEEGISDRVRNLVKLTLKQLYDLQCATENQVDYTKTFEYKAYDKYPIAHDLFYFKFMFADVMEVSYHKTSLLKEFEKLTTKIELLEPKGLMIRDFQSRNIMVKDDEVYFIDYQSAMHGPLMYDVISFLYQAKANFPENFRQEMLDYYFSLWKDETIVSKLKVSVKSLQLIRFLQVLGAYGFRGLVQRKNHFISSIMSGVENIYQFVDSWEHKDDFPQLVHIIVQLHDDECLSKIHRLIEN